MSFRKESGAENMATDMWLLAQCGFMGWSSLQKIWLDKAPNHLWLWPKSHWVEKETGEQITALTRRPTGGGIVPMEPI